MFSKNGQYHLGTYYKGKFSGPQWFSNFGICENHLEGLKNRFLGPTPRFLTLLVQGPYSENNSLKEYLVLSAYRAQMLCRAPGSFHLVPGLRKGLRATGDWVAALFPP